LGVEDGGLVGRGGAILIPPTIDLPDDLPTVPVVLTGGGGGAIPLPCGGAGGNGGPPFKGYVLDGGGGGGGAEFPAGARL